MTRRRRARTSAASASWRKRTGSRSSRSARARTTRSRRKKERRWSESAPCCTGVKIPPQAMGFADVWNRTLVYFGIAEDEDEWDEDGYVTNEDLERTYSERPNVRRLTPRRRQSEFDDWTDPEPEPARTALLRPARQRRMEAAAAPPSPVQVHLVVPRSFNDA